MYISDTNWFEETLITERRMATYAKGCSYFSLHLTITKRSSAADNNFSESFLSDCPSNNVITKLFVASFLADEQIYCQEIDSVLIDSKLALITRSKSPQT